MLAVFPNLNSFTSCTGTGCGVISSGEMFKWAPSPSPPPISPPSSPPMPPQTPPHPPLTPPPPLDPPPPCLPPSPEPPPAPPLSHMFCGASSGYQLFQDGAQGDKCVGQGDSTNWCAPLPTPSPQRLVCPPVLPSPPTQPPPPLATTRVPPRESGMRYALPCACLAPLMSCDASRSLATTLVECISSRPRDSEFG